jgi:hypothetical protein
LKRSYNTLRRRNHHGGFGTKLVIDLVDRGIVRKENEAKVFSS